MAIREPSGLKATANTLPSRVAGSPKIDAVTVWLGASRHVSLPEYRSVVVVAGMTLPSAGLPGASPAVKLAVSLTTPLTVTLWPTSPWPNSQKTPCANDWK